MSRERDRLTPVELLETIQADCITWEEAVNRGKVYYHYLYLNKCANSEESRLYQLILNGRELWYGTLEEINAVVKSIIRLTVEAGEYGL